MGRGSEGSEGGSGSSQSGTRFVPISGRRRRSPLSSAPNETDPVTGFDSSWRRPIRSLTATFPRVVGEDGEMSRSLRNLRQ